jgi:hypothetical protein
MALLLGQVDDEQREFRWSTGALLVALSGAAFAGSALTPNYAASDRARWSVVALGGGLLGLGVYQLLRDPPSEHLHAELTQGLASHDDPGEVIARVDRKLHAAAASAAHTRWAELGIGALLVAGSATIYGLGAHDVGGWGTSDGQGGSNTDFIRPVITATAALGAMAIVAGSIKSPIERATRLWDTDPGLELPRVGIAPVSGGASITVAGGF